MPQNLFRSSKALARRIARSALPARDESHLASYLLVAVVLASVMAGCGGNLAMNLKAATTTGEAQPYLDIQLTGVRLSRGGAVSEVATNTKLRQISPPAGHVFVVLELELVNEGMSAIVFESSQLVAKTRAGDSIALYVFETMDNNSQGYLKFAWTRRLAPWERYPCKFLASVKREDRALILQYARGNPLIVTF